MIAVAAAIAVLALTVIAASASAAAAGRDGQIHACYRVKGKPSGSLRVLPSARARCGRGERKLAWSLTGAAAQGASVGPQGRLGRRENRERSGGRERRARPEPKPRPQR